MPAILNKGNTEHRPSLYPQLSMEGQVVRQGGACRTFRRHGRSVRKGAPVEESPRCDTMSREGRIESRFFMTDAILHCRLLTKGFRQGERPQRQNLLISCEKDTKKD
jgi:hypothetical protein